MSKTVTETKFQGGGKNLDVEYGKFVMPATSTEVIVDTELKTIHDYEIKCFVTTAATSALALTLQGTVVGTGVGEQFGYAVAGGTVGFVRNTAANQSNAYFYKLMGNY